MPRLVRGAVLNGYVEVARSVGLDPYQMIAAHRLPAACLTDPDLKIPMTSVARLLEESAACSKRPDFALLLAERRSLANLGVLSMLVREQPTVRKALEALSNYLYLHSDGLRLTIEESEDFATVGLVLDAGSPIPLRQGTELAVAFIHRSLQQLLGRGWRADAICFSYAAPARTDPYRRFFGTEVRFSQDHNGIVCRVRLLEAAVSASDPAIASHVQHYLDSIAPRPHAPVREKVRECIYLSLSSGLCSADRVAAILGVDRRTLHRQLAREGETFSSLLAAVRTELASRYIGNHNRALASVAELLGFSGLSAFSRWFRGRFGCSVSEWRKSASFFDQTVNISTPADARKTVR